MVPISDAAKGEQGWPLLGLLKVLLLARWYDLSDVKLAEALDDRASFRRFCGFSRNETTPDRAAFVRFRRTLAALDLGERLFEAITEQLYQQHVQVKRGTLVDATIIARHQIEVNKWCLELGGHCRTGLEDNIKFDRDRLAASNAELVARVSEICGDYGRHPASPAEARDLLGIRAA